MRRRPKFFLKIKPQEFFFGNRLATLSFTCHILTKHSLYESLGTVV